MRCALLVKLVGVSAWLVAHEPERQLSGARALSESVSTPSTAAAPWSVPRLVLSSLMPDSMSSTCFGSAWSLLVISHRIESVT